MSQCHFVHHRSHRDWPGIESGLRRESLAAKHVSSDTVYEWRECKFQLHVSFILSAWEGRMQVSKDEPKSCIRTLSQRNTNSKRQFAVTATFCTVASNVCWSSVCNLFRVIHRATRISDWLLDFWRMCATRYYTIQKSASIIWLFWNYLQPLGKACPFSLEWKSQFHVLS